MGIFRNAIERVHLWNLRNDPYTAGMEAINKAVPIPVAAHLLDTASRQLLAEMGPDHKYAQIASGYTDILHKELLAEHERQRMDEVGLDMQLPVTIGELGSVATREIGFELDLLHTGPRDETLTPMRSVQVQLNNCIGMAYVEWRLNPGTEIPPFPPEA